MRGGLPGPPVRVRPLPGEENASLPPDPLFVLFAMSATFLIGRAPAKSHLRG
jgi:hypothetical protein